MRILIVKLGAIGDVLRTTSILPGLLEKYPSAQIDWLTSAGGKEILLNNRLLNRIWLWNERGELGQYDLVIGLEDELEVCQVVSRVGKTVKGAYSGEGKVLYTPSAWFDMSVISKYGLEKANALKKKNTKTYQQHMADLLGISVSPYVFGLTAEEREYGRRVVKGLGLGQGRGLVGINTGAGKRWEYKALSVEKTIELVRRLKDELGTTSLILGGEEEKERNQRIARETGMPEAGQHSLRHFAAIINQCDAVISSDSLAMHFAIALKKPLVVFFGPTSAAEIEMYGLGKKIQPEMDCLTCYLKQCAKKPNCVDLMPVEELFGAVKSL